MKILHVITSLRIGGAEKLVSEIVPMLRDKGNTVDVCVFDGVSTAFYESLQRNGIKVISFGTDCNVYNPLFIFKLFRLMRGYDIVHTHNTAPQFFAAICSVKKSNFLITTEHSTSNRRRGRDFYGLVDKWMYRRYDRVICISDKAEDKLKEYLPSLKNICTIYNGVDTNKFHIAQGLEILRPKEKKVITMVAGFRFEKDQDTLIKAISILDKSKYELWLIGDGERRANLESLVKELDVVDNVKFLGIRSDIPELLHTADIVVMSSHYEGLSLSSVEGMSVGKPFVASDVDGLREVTAGYGILFPYGDANALAAEIEHLAADEAYYRQVADKCWERAQMFDIQKMVDGYQKVYEEVMKGKTNGR